MEAVARKKANTVVAPRWVFDTFLPPTDTQSRRNINHDRIFASLPFTFFIQNHCNVFFEHQPARPPRCSPASSAPPPPCGGSSFWVSPLRPPIKPALIQWPFHRVPSPLSLSIDCPPPFASVALRPPFPTCYAPPSSPSTRLSCHPPPHHRHSSFASNYSNRSVLLVLSLCSRWMPPRFTSYEPFIRPSITFLQPRLSVPSTQLC